ncbi:hypothetical protein STCU_05738 [Strigomonas culicis]|nr:hypothetical protein STCU_05738 [Strigomonas culicis]|eukprot:EPY27463.1 hypothetical protein STCU_05738 [Strigomonas culicis]
MGFSFAPDRAPPTARHAKQGGSGDRDAAPSAEEENKKVKADTDDAPPSDAPAPDGTVSPGEAPVGGAPQSALAKMIQAAKTKQDEQKAVPNSAQADHSESEDDEDDFGVILPSTMQRAPAPSRAAAAATSTAGAPLAEKHPSQMTREEFLSQFKRPPRPGEIGRSAEEIAAAESLGYVMSGSRSKAAQLYMNRIQRQLHEREASQLQQQFRKVEDEHMDEELVSGLAQLLNAKKK